jgi:hypothetical protein
VWNLFAKLEAAAIKTDKIVRNPHDFSAKCPKKCPTTIDGLKYKKP